MIQFENHEKTDDDADEKFIYVLVVQETTMPFVDRYIYIVSFKILFPSFNVVLSPLMRANWTWNAIEILIVLILPVNN